MGFKLERNNEVINPQLLGRACIKYKYYITKKTSGCYVLKSSTQNSIAPVIIMVENSGGKVKVTPKLGIDYRFNILSCITTFEQIDCLKSELQRAQNDAKLIEEILLLPSIQRTYIKNQNKNKVIFSCPHCGNIVSSYSCKCPYCKKEYFNSAQNQAVLNKYNEQSENNFK